MIIDAANGVLYAATRKGLYSSTDGGVSFTAKVTGSGSDVHCLDIEIANTNPEQFMQPLDYLIEAEIWRSTDAGSKFYPKYYTCEFR